MQVLHRCVAEDGAEVAYAVSGEGPPLVLPAWWISDLERDWEDPRWRGFLSQLGEGHTVVRYDRPGVGQSRGARDTFTQDQEVAYLDAVVRDLDAGPVAMLGQSCGGPPAVSYAAREPDLVSKLVLYASYSCGADLAPPKAREALVAMVRATWGSVGSRALSDMFKPDADRSEVTEFARYQREVADPDVAADLLQLTYDMDARAEAPLVQCPVLVLHRRGDRAIPLRCGLALAELIPTASVVELDGADHSMNDGDVAALLLEVERFLLGHSAREFVTRKLSTVLFTDIVDSTRLATELGDQAWRTRLNEHDRITETAVAHAGGRVVKTTGDGVLAVFDLPTQALTCARNLHRELARLGIQITVGVHAGEIELRGDDVAGIAVNIAARVQARAADGTTLATSTVRELSAGSGFEFVEVETTSLKGVEGEWTTYTVRG